MAVSRFVQPVSDAEMQASTLPGNMKASTNCRIHIWSEWAASRVTADAHHKGVVPVTTALLEMPSTDLAYWMGEFVLEVRKKDGKEYLLKSLYALVCCFKCYYEQNGGFDVNPLSSSNARFGNFTLTVDAEMKRLWVVYQLKTGRTYYSR